jgi:hypothetical protein
MHDEFSEIPLTFKEFVTNPQQIFFALAPQ